MYNILFKLIIIITAIFCHSSCAIKTHKVRYINSQNSFEGSSLEIGEPTILDELKEVGEYYTSIDWGPMWNRRSLLGEHNFYLAGTTSNGRVNIWEFNYEKNDHNVNLFKSFKLDHHVNDVAWDPTGRQIAFEMYNELEKMGFIGLLEINRELDGPPILGSFFSVSYDKVNRVVNEILRTSSERKILLRQLKGIQWSPDGKILVSKVESIYYDLINFWSPQYDGKNSLIKMKMNSRHNDYTYWSDRSWSPDGKYLVTANFDGVRLWSYPSIRKLFADGVLKLSEEKEISWSPSELFIYGSKYHETHYDIAWSPDGEYIASYKIEPSNSEETDRDFVIVIWEVVKPFSRNISLEVHKVIRVKNERVFSLKWSPDGQYIVYGTHNQQKNVVGIRISDINLKESIVIPTQHIYDKYSFAEGKVLWSPDGSFIASISRDNTIRLWPVKFK